MQQTKQQLDQQTSTSRLVRRSAIEKQVRQFLTNVQAAENGNGHKSERVTRQTFERAVKRGVSQTLRQLRQLGAKIAD